MGRGGIKDHRDYKTACSSGTGDRLFYTSSKREESHSLTVWRLTTHIWVVPHR